MDLNIKVDENKNSLSNFFNKKNKKTTLIIFIGVLVFLFLFSAPFKQKEIMIHITSGQSVSSVAQNLKDNNVIRSRLILKGFVKILKSGKGIVSGDYLIKRNSPVFVVAWQISRGHYNVKATKVTLREGLTNKQMADILSQKIQNFDKELFLEKANGKQGYLFPDTYLIYPLDTTEEIIKKLEDNFINRTKKLGDNIPAEKIIMASILEGEASGKEDAYIISGILWRRLNIGMPLQVDVDKTTYKENGLPAGPINNPGLVSIDAAINPTSSSYLYYLHDKNGKVHFAKSYEEHRSNINKYLK